MKDAITPKWFGRAPRPDRALRLLSRALRVALKTTPLLSPRYPRAARRALRLIGTDLFTAREILHLGLLDPALSSEDLQRFTSRQAMTILERRLNPVAWRTLVENKGIFYRYCSTHRLPVPRLYGIYLGRAEGWACDSTRATREEWIDFFQSGCPPELVIKPAEGAYGDDIRVLKRTREGAFIDASGTVLTASELVSRLDTGAGTRGWVIQERVRNHALLAQLSGTSYLQCARLITLTDREGKCRLLHSHLKLIVGQNAIDNFDSGATGNLTARVNLADGTLVAALTRNPSGPGYVAVRSHPETGALIEGFQLPLWTEACQLAREAAHDFAPLRFIGWDIAITPTRAVLIEANWNCDPTNPHRNMNGIREAMLRQV